MVEVGRFPGSGFVTGAALFPKLAFVCIVFQVTCAAIGGRRFEIGCGVSAEMTFGAGLPNVFAFQFEGSAAVVKVLANGLKPIMTAPAFCSVSLCMALHESGVYLLVAGGAGGWGKFGDVGSMTV